MLAEPKWVCHQSVCRKSWSLNGAGVAVATATPDGGSRSVVGVLLTVVSAECALSTQYAPADQRETRAVLVGCAGSNGVPGPVLLVAEGLSPEVPKKYLVDVADPMLSVKTVEVLDMDAFGVVVSLGISTLVAPPLDPATAEPVASRFKSCGLAKARGVARIIWASMLALMGRERILTSERWEGRPRMSDKQ